jgi:hypothetical protein
MNWILSSDAQPSQNDPKWVYCKDTNSFHKAFFKNGKWYDATAVYSLILQVSHWIEPVEFEKIIPLDAH